MGHGMKEENEIENLWGRIKGVTLRAYINAFIDWEENVRPANPLHSCH